MKELSMQEKARRYDEAIKLVNSKWYYKNQPCIIDVSEIFPELKDENETIRKELINFINSHLAGFPQCEKYIAWIEKQINDEDIHLLKLKAKAYDDAKERMSYAYNQNRVPIGFISEIFPNLDLYKTQDDEPVFETNKIEPKFKIGDWIIFNGLTFYINEIVQGYYRTISKGGIYNSYDWDIDNAARLWTIADAKEGDVLSYKDEILLYKHYIKNCTKQEENFGSVVYYCCYDGKRFIVNNLYSLTEEDKTYIHPVTKEQYKLLCQKMKEAGYKWDENKKEFIKL